MEIILPNAKGRESPMSEKQVGFTLRAAESELLADIQEKVHSCMQCGTCSGSCANSFAMDLNLNLALTDSFREKIKT